MTTKLEVLQIVAKRVKEKREELNLTQSELAKIIGKTRGDISNLENAKSKNPTLKYIFNIANALGIELWELFKSESQQKIVDTKNLHGLEEMLNILMQKNINVTEDELQLLKNLKIKGQYPESPEIYLFFWILQRSAAVEDVVKLFKSQ